MARDIAPKFVQAGPSEATRNRSPGDMTCKAHARMLVGQKPDPPENLPEGRGPRAYDEVARTVGLGSGRTYERSKQVIDAFQREEDGPRLLQHVASGPSSFCTKMGR